MGLGLIDDFRAVVRAALGLPPAGEPPDLMRLGLYRARVDVCAQDGSSVDVTPADKRLPPTKNAKLLAGIPGAVAIVQPGAIVHLGWERGDPSSPYCVPCWESGATVTKLTFAAQAVNIGGTSGDNVLTKSDMAALITAIQGATYVNAAGSPTALVFTPPSTYASNSVKATR